MYYCVQVTHMVSVRHSSNGKESKKSKKGEIYLPLNPGIIIKGFRALDLQC